MTKSQKSRFEVAVTAADIERAKQNNSFACVVTQAIARTLPTATRIETDIQTIRFSLDGTRYAFLTPYSVQGYVVAFDAGDEIHPFRFRLYENQKVAVRQTRKTPAGSAIATADTKATRTRRKATTARQQLEMTLDRADAALTDPSLPPPTPEEVRAIKAEIRAADAAVKAADVEKTAVRAAYAGQKQTEETKGRRVPRVHPRKERAYGHRLLRINQAE